MKHPFTQSLRILALTCLITGVSAQTQQATTSPDLARGIQLYEQGDAAGSIESLRRAIATNEKDGAAWHYLGLAYLLKGNRDDARRAFGRAVAVREAGLQGSLMVATTVPDPTMARQTRSQRFGAAADSLEKYIQLSKSPDASLVEELETLQWYRDYYAGVRNDEEIVVPKEATTRLRILNKPNPNFSGTRATGTAALRAVFSADGTVKHILMIHRIDPEFDRACMLAARRIQFEPAMKDGHAVSTILQVEYGRFMY